MSINLITVQYTVRDERVWNELNHPRTVSNPIFILIFWQWQEEQFSKNKEETGAIKDHIYSVMGERGRNELVIIVINQSVLETTRQTEQDRNNGHGGDNHPCSGCTAASDYFQRLADSDIAINSQQYCQPGINQTHTVHERIEDDEDVTVNVVVSGPADITNWLS